MRIGYYFFICYIYAKFVKLCIFCIQIRGLQRLYYANYYWCPYLMDQQINNMNNFYGDNDSFHFPGSTQDRTLCQPSFEIKHMEQLISPANIPLGHRYFMQSPRPFKQNIGFQEQEQSVQQENHQSLFFEHRINEICTIINFNESPHKKNYHYEHGSIESNPCLLNPDLKVLRCNYKYEKNNSKGLRSLSKNVYRIVLDHKITTYKQVADSLVKMLNSGQFGSLNENFNNKSKDEQNIKRRVYDALNVLMSADILKKNGKYVMSQQQDKISQKTKQTQNGNKEDRDSLLQQILKKQNQIIQKKHKITEIQAKKQILNAILKRNRKKKILQEQKVNFPFIGLVYNNHQPKIKRIQNKSKVLIQNFEQLQIFGDIDLLMKVGIDILNQNIQQIIEEDDVQDLEAEKKASKKLTTQSSTYSDKQKTAKVLYSL